MDKNPQKTRLMAALWLAAGFFLIFGVPVLAVLERSRPAVAVATPGSWDLYNDSCGFCCYR